jgi:hypothetical protein
MNNLFKSSVPGASPGRECDDSGDLPVGPGRDPHIAGSDYPSRATPRAAGISAMKPRIVGPIPAFEREQKSDSGGCLLDPGRPNVKCRASKASAKPTAGSL